MTEKQGIPATFHEFDRDKDFMLLSYCFMFIFFRLSLREMAVSSCGPHIFFFGALRSIYSSGQQIYQQRT
jgi:hypothetical protein